jgi:hypothetical protein
VVGWDQKVGNHFKISAEDFAKTVFFAELKRQYRRLTCQLSIFDNFVTKLILLLSKKELKIIGNSVFSKTTQ